MKKIDIGKISVIPLAVLQEDLTVNQLKVFIAIASFQCYSDDIEISMAEIAKRAGLWKVRGNGEANINAVSRAVQELVEKELIVKTKERFGGAYKYKILFNVEEYEAEEVAKKVNDDQKINKEDLQDVFEAWNNAGIIKHISVTDKISRAIQTALMLYPKDKIIKAIHNYSYVVHSPDHFFKYKWILHDFLKRGLDKFVDEADPINNFKREKIATKKRETVEELYGKKYDI